MRWWEGCEALVGLHIGRGQDEGLGLSGPRDVEGLWDRLVRAGDPEAQVKISFRGRVYIGRLSKEQMGFRDLGRGGVNPHGELPTPVYLMASSFNNATAFRSSIPLDPLIQKTSAHQPCTLEILGRGLGAASVCDPYRQRGWHLTVGCLPEQSYCPAMSREASSCSSGGARPAEL